MLRYFSFEYRIHLEFFRNHAAVAYMTQIIFRVLVQLRQETLFRTLTSYYAFANSTSWIGSWEPIWQNCCLINVLFCFFITRSNTTTQNGIIPLQLSLAWKQLSRKLKVELRSCDPMRYHRSANKTSNTCCSNTPAGEVWGLRDIITIAVN